MDRFKPVDMPYTGYEMMSFSEEREARIKAIVKRARSENEWEYARDVKLDLSDEYFCAYWLNKTAEPIQKPLIGCGELEELFSAFKNTHFELNGGNRGNSLSLSVAGDLMCTKGLEDSKDVLYEDVAPFIFDSDIRYANLESTFSSGTIAPTKFSSEEAPKINLNLGQYKTLTEYKGKKYNIVQLANNHIVDCGEEGVRATLAQLEKDGIQQVGVNPTEDYSSRTTITERSGLKIGWVAHTLFVNYRPLPEGKPWMVNITPFHIADDPDLSNILQQIKYCRDEKCNLIVVALHWGLEFEFYPHPKQREWAQIFADAGADIIIGHHPHVIQFSEIIHPRYDPSKDVPVVYSLGNLTPVLSGPATVLSLLAKFDIDLEKDFARVTGLNLLPTALVEHCSTDGTSLELKKLRTLQEMKPELDEKMRDYVDEMSGYADMILGPSWQD